MATLLMPLPDSDFDPTESGVPWRTMRDHGHRVVFATPSGRTARADPKMVTGEGLGILSPLLKADANGRSAYLKMEQSDADFQRPISYGEIRAVDFDALLLTGGHTPPVCGVYLGSGVLQSAVGDFFAQEKPVGAICHGVLLAARSSLHSGKSVLYGKKTTALTKQMELIAWRLTRLYLGDLAPDLSDDSRGRGSIGVGAARRLHQRAPAGTPRSGGAARRGIHGARRRLLIGTVAWRRASLSLRIRDDDRLTAFAPGVGRHADYLHF